MAQQTNSHKPMWVRLVRLRSSRHYVRCKIPCGLSSSCTRARYGSSSSAARSSWKRSRHGACPDDGCVELGRGIAPDSYPPAFCRTCRHIPNRGDTLVESCVVSRPCDRARVGNTATGRRSEQHATCAMTSDSVTLPRVDAYDPEPTAHDCTDSRHALPEVWRQNLEMDVCETHGREYLKSVSPP